MDAIIYEILNNINGRWTDINVSIKYFLSIKLRKKRSNITEAIIDGVPERLKFRVLFGINAHMSWVAAAYVMYIWFAYLLYRYGWHVTHNEFTTWHQAIKKAFGGYFILD